MADVISQTTFVFTLLHRTDERPATVEEALREAYDGHAVGAVVHALTGPVPDATVPDALVGLGNDGTFFDIDLAEAEPA
jgi:hypothetical protein